jgi:hypothetical protein
MNKKQINVFMAGIAILSGCATISASKIPGNSIASNKLKADVINMINMVERAQAPGCQYSIIDTKFVGKEGETFFEEWTVLSCDKRIIYPVKFRPSPEGGTDFAVTTPDMKLR